MSDTLHRPGGYYIHKAGSSRRRPLPTIEEAVAVAQHIQSLNPEHSFIIAHEVARVVPRG